MKAAFIFCPCDRYAAKGSISTYSITVPRSRPIDFAFMSGWARNARRDMGWISRIETGRQSFRRLRAWPRPRLNVTRWRMRALVAAVALLGLNAPAARANVLIAIDKSTQQ